MLPFALGLSTFAAAVWSQLARPVGLAEVGRRLRLAETWLKIPSCSLQVERVNRATNPDGIWRSPGALRCTRRTVPVIDRITTVSVSITSFPNFTPRSIGPEVTPVAANRQSPRTISSISNFLFGSLMPILDTRCVQNLGVDDKARLHLAADAAQRRRGQHTRLLCRSQP